MNKLLIYFRVVVIISFLLLVKDGVGQSRDIILNIGGHNNFYTWENTLTDYRNAVTAPMIGIHYEEIYLNSRSKSGYFHRPYDLTQ